MRNLLTSVLAGSILIGNSYGQTVSSDKMSVDDYCITNKMLADTINHDSSYKMGSGKVFSLDKVWFTNDTLNQTLIFDLYTDYHRYAIYHFQNKDIPSKLLKRLELYISTSPLNNIFDTASFKLKESSMIGFINQSNKINHSYFTSNKGFKLGDNKAKAISLYGKPNKDSVSEGIEMLVWDYEGDYAENETVKKSNNRLAKDSFGYHVIMFFRTDKLLAMILFNDIP